MKNKNQQGISFIFFTLLGGGIALALFLGLFILSSRAKTPDPRSSLRIPVPQVPQLPSPSPRQRLISTPPPESENRSASEAGTIPIETPLSQTQASQLPQL